MFSPPLLLLPHTNLLCSHPSPYPIRRALPLVEAISRDLNEQLLKVLGSQRLTHLEYPSFERAMLACSAVFNAWDDSLKEFTNVAREVTRKRSEKFLPIKINPAHAALQERVVYLRGFRKQHHELQVMVGPLGNDTKRSGDGREVERVSVLNDIDMDAEVSLFGRSNGRRRIELTLLSLLPRRSVRLTSRSKTSTSSTSPPVRLQLSPSLHFSTTDHRCHRRGNRDLGHRRDELQRASLARGASDHLPPSLSPRQRSHLQRKVSRLLQIQRPFRQAQDSR